MEVREEVNTNGHIGLSWLCEYDTCFRKAAAVTEEETEDDHGDKDKDEKNKSFTVHFSVDSVLFFCHKTAISSMVHWCVGSSISFVLAIRVPEVELGILSLYSLHPKQSCKPLPLCPVPALPLADAEARQASEDGLCCRCYKSCCCCCWC